MPVYIQYVCVCPWVYFYISNKFISYIPNHKSSFFLFHIKFKYMFVIEELALQPPSFLLTWPLPSPTQSSKLSSKASKWMAKNKQNYVREVFFNFFFLRATLEAYGGSQARGPTRAVASGLHHSDGNARSELCLQPTPQLMAMPDL